MGIRTRIRIKEGVERGLCGTCNHSRIARGDSEQQVWATCTYGQETPIPFIVRECNLYRRMDEMSMYQMEKIAWDVADKEDSKAGFVPTNLVTPPKKKDEDI